MAEMSELQFGEDTSEKNKEYFFKINVLKVLISQRARAVIIES